MTIGKKCFLMAGTMMALLVGLAFSSWLSAGTLAALLNQSAGSTSRKMLAVGEIEVSVEHLRTAQRGVILYSMLKNPAVVQRSKDLFQSGTGEIRKLAIEAETLMATDEERRSLKTILAQLDAWQPLYEQVARMSDAGQFDDQPGGRRDRGDIREPD